MTHRVWQMYRGTTVQVDAVTPVSGELIWETDGLQLAIGDGSTAGGKHVMMQASTKKATITIAAAAISGEEHAYDISYAGILSSGDSMVGINVAVTPTGTAGVWVSGIYAKVTQGATKAVNGYISGAEFEVVNSADNVSDWFPLVLDATNNGANNGSHEAYIALRDYGTNPLSRLLWFGDQSIGSKSDTSLVSTFADGAHITHAIRIIVGTTELRLLASSVLPSTT